MSCYCVNFNKNKGALNLIIILNLLLLNLKIFNYNFILNIIVFIKLNNKQIMNETIELNENTKFNIRKENESELFEEYKERPLSRFLNQIINFNSLIPSSKEIHDQQKQNNNNNNKSVSIYDF
jgi:hypothetical protein